MIKLSAIPLFCLVTSFAFGQNNHASNTSSASQDILLEQMLSKADLRNNMVRMEVVTFPPGYESGPHSHPCPLFGYVIEGELVSVFEGLKKVYKPGTAFYESPNGLHSLTKKPQQDRHP